MTNDDIPSLDEAYPDDYVGRKPPEENKNRCHNCDMPFVPDQWDVRHLHGGPSAGETWIYTCPSCEKETVEIGT